MATLLGPRYGIRRGFVNGVEYKVTLCGDGSFSLVIYRRGQAPEYHLDLTEEQVNERLAELLQERAPNAS